jgi:hypothetical protein
MLLETARNHVKDQTFNNPDIACVFLVGSLTGNDPFVGETTDIDLVFIHNTEPKISREIVTLADDFQFDVLHFPRRVFNQPKELRQDPWLGCLFCDTPFVLYDSYHYYDFLRAGVFSNFYSAPYIYARSQFFYTQARDRWMNLQHQEDEFSADTVYDYLLTLYDAGNCIACLTGKPLSERRFLSRLESCTAYLGRPGLASGMRDLYGINDYADFPWESSLQQMGTAVTALSEKPYCPPQYSPARLRYYQNAVSFYQVERPDEALWVLFWVWTNIIRALPKRAPEAKEWKIFCEQINFTRDIFSQKIQQLDSYLEAVDTTSLEWKKVSGLL